MYGNNKGQIFRDMEYLPLVNIFEILNCLMSQRR